MNTNTNNYEKLSKISKKQPPKREQLKLEILASSLSTKQKSLLTN